MILCSIVNENIVFKLLKAKDYPLPHEFSTSNMYLLTSIDTC